MRTSLRFALRFGLAALVQFLVLLAPPVRPYIDGFSASLASTSSGLIHLFGGACVQNGDILSTPNNSFAMQVLDGCNGVNVVILLWAAIIAFPASWKWRLIGLGGGLVAIQVLNLLRLISLFYLGQINYAVFEFAHLYLWETLIIIDAIVVFALWNKRALQAQA
jgi:exosortase H (IPTLxxWG-CTERM-specific)